jgi:hypothetical protein
VIVKSFNDAQFLPEGDWGSVRTPDEVHLNDEGRAHDVAPPVLVEPPDIAPPLLVPPEVAPPVLDEPPEPEPPVAKPEPFALTAATAGRAEEEVVAQNPKPDLAPGARFLFQSSGRATSLPPLVVSVALHPLETVEFARST